MKKIIEQKNVEEFENNEKLDELYRPHLIHATTYMILTEQILMLMPSDRNVILSMNEYDLREINPAHPNTSDSPTHIIIFCIRFIADDLFQPVGGLLIYKYQNQSAILAECVKAYINDLWKLGLHVVATVSPPFETFKGILSHLVDVQDFNSYAGVLSYSVTPFKEIIHIYDIQFLLIKLQNLFKESDIRFEEENLHDKRVYQASWADIAMVLNSSKEFKVLLDYLLHNRESSRRVHIFTDQIYSRLLEASARDALSANGCGSVVLLNCIRTFFKFSEENFVDVYKMNRLQYWDSLVPLLKTMQFQKSKNRTCTKDQPYSVHIVKNSSTRRKIDFQENKADLKKSDGNGILMNDKAVGEKMKTRNKKSRKKKTHLVGNESLTNICDNSVTEKLLNITETKACNKIGFQNLNVNEDVKALIKNNKSQKTDKNLGNVNRVNKESHLVQDCDIDNNNNSDDSQKSRPRKTKKKHKIKEQQFDVVIDDPLAFIQSLTDMNTNFVHKNNSVNGASNRSYDETFHQSSNNSYPRSNDVSSSSSNGDFYTNFVNQSCNDHNYAKKCQLTSNTEKRNNEMSSIEKKTKKQSFFYGYSDVPPPKGKVNAECFETASNYSSKNSSVSSDIDNSKSDFVSEFVVSGLNREKGNNTKRQIGNEDISSICGLREVDMPNSGENNFNDSSTSNNPWCNRSIDNYSLDSNIASSSLSNTFQNFSIAENGSSQNDLENSLVLENDIFSSKSDEETEKSIKESCDEVPNILKLLNNVDDFPPNLMASDFEENSVTFEMLCTVFGMEKLLRIIFNRRVRIAKPDAFIVEHIDFLVTVIKETNKLPNVRYFGHNYHLLNTELALSTLQNNKGLYLVKKD